MQIDSDQKERNSCGQNLYSEKMYTRADPKRREALCKALACVPHVLIDIILSYEPSMSNAYFIPFRGARSKYTKSPRKTGLSPSSLYVLEKDVFEKACYLKLTELTCPPASSFWDSVYPAEWPTYKCQSIEGIITHKLGKRMVMPVNNNWIVSPYLSEEDCARFKRICKVDCDVVQLLTVLLEAEAKNIRVSDKAYEDAIDDSLIMLDPYSLDLHTFAASLENTYAKLKEVYDSPDIYRTLPELILPCPIKKFIKT
jgi:hypothetical protein